MQTLSNMRRNSSHKHTLLAFLFLVGFYTYESIASMQIFMPPLLGVCLCLFLRFDSQDKFYSFLTVCIGVLLIESENNLPLGMLFGLFLFLGFFIIPRVQAVLNTPKIARASYVVLAYFGFYLLALLFDWLWGSVITPNVWIIIYYIVLEMCMVVFL